MVPPRTPSVIATDSMINMSTDPVFAASGPVPVGMPRAAFFAVSPRVHTSHPAAVLLLFATIILHVDITWTSMGFAVSDKFGPSPAYPPVIPQVPSVSLVGIVYWLVDCFVMAEVSEDEDIELSFAIECGRSSLEAAKGLPTGLCMVR